ncbi:MAG: hypothetical protein ACTSV1_08145 [Alphaproteobacteria bacterium]
MKNCDTCPGNTDCAGTNLHRMLSQVLGLYAAGMTDKMEILFALGEENEALLERYTYRVESDCWTKAALLSIADACVLMDPDDTEELLTVAIKAFEWFPWELGELIEQAPDLYQAINDSRSDDDFGKAVSKRAFVKICKKIAFG